MSLQFFKRRFTTAFVSVLVFAVVAVVAQFWVLAVHDDSAQQVKLVWQQRDKVASLEQLTELVESHHRAVMQRMVVLNSGLLVLFALLMFWLSRSKLALSTQIDFENSQMRHQVSDARQHSEATEARMQMNARLSPDLIWVKNLAGVYQYCNHPYELFHGCKLDDIVGKSDFELFDEATARAFQATDRQVLTLPDPLRLEDWHMSADKSRECLFEIIKTALLDDSGQAMGVQGVARDITLQHQTQAAFRQAQERLTLLDMCISKISDVVIITDADPEHSLGPRILFVNEAFEHVTGYSRAEALGNSPRMLSCTTILQPERARLQDALRRQVGVRVELINLTKAGQRIWVDMDLTPVPNDKGQVSHWVGIQRDITARKKTEAHNLQLLEKAAESSRLKTEFIANVSHEIRTPMNGILGMAQLLLDLTLTVKQQHLVQMLHDSALGLMKMLDDLLDFRKIEAGTLWLQSELFSVRELVHECQETVKVAARARQLEVSSVVDEQVPPLVVGDAGRVRQVLKHLLDNAVKYTPQGKVTLMASVLQYADNRPFLHFEVTDSGIGISDEQSAMLFRPFVQVNGSSTRSRGGTGLGLVLSSRLVELMHGHMGVISALGQGTTVWFAVPLLLSPEVPSDEAQKVPEAFTE